MATPVPTVEVTDHTDTLGVGRPDGEQDAADAVGLVLVRAEDVEGVTVPAFAKEMQIKVADLRQESVGVAGEAFAAFAVAPDQRVMLR